MPVDQKKWQNKTIFIIGGGPSLRGLDLDNDLQEKIVVGCNDAYQLSCTDVCIFGDFEWWKIHKKQLLEWNDEIWSNCNSAKEIDSIHYLRKSPNLSNSPDACAWFGNTGYLALNFALLHNPKKIVLLGYDMDLLDGKSNWHDQNKSHPHRGSYNSMLKKLPRMFAEIQKYYPDVEIINANPISRINHFEKRDPSEFGIKIPENHIYRK